MATRRLVRRARARARRSIPGTVASMGLLGAVGFGIIALIERAGHAAEPVKGEGDCYSEPPPAKEEMERIAATLRPLRIGLLATTQKARKILGGIEECTRSNGISIEHIPFSPPAANAAVEEKTSSLSSSSSSSSLAPPNPPPRGYDILLQKIGNSCTPEAAAEACRRFDEAVAQSPRACIIDSPTDAARASDRRAHMAICAKGLGGERRSKFAFAPSAVLEGHVADHVASEGESEARAWLAERKLHFPLLYKPVDNHGICAVFNARGLAAAAEGCRPAVVQEYVPHAGNKLYKVYILGDETIITRRRSLPLLTASESKANWHFGRISANSMSAGEAQEAFGEIDPKMATDMMELAGAMRGLLRLQLFNFDAVVEIETGQLVVVDVNHFPGYQKCITDLGPRFLRFLARSYRKHKTAPSLLNPGRRNGDGN